jgi:glutamyl-tRNA synthetase
MLAVVVDDHDMNVTHIIRGEDHLTNTFRQRMIFDAMGWKMPMTAHVPLIHGADGAKLSKRHGAQGVEEYRDMGYLPEAVNNYLMSLGWHYGDEETITIEEAIKRFDVAHVGKSPSRFDFTKLNHINGVYLRRKSADEIFDLAQPFLNKLFGDVDFNIIKKLIPAVAERSQTLLDFSDNCRFIFNRLPYTEKASKMLEQGKQYLPEIVKILENISDWNADEIKKNLDDYGVANNLKHGMYMPPIRASICGTMESPNLVDVMAALGKDEALKRMKNL